MKKFFALLLTLAMVLSLAACSEKKEETKEETTTETTETTETPAEYPHKSVTKSPEPVQVLPFIPAVSCIEKGASESWLALVIIPLSLSV